MDLHELFLVAGYEVKQQGRSWVFRFFALLSLVGIVACHIYWQGQGADNWKMMALSCSMPLVNAYLYSVMQSLFLAVMMADIPRRLCRPGALDSTRARPADNATYYWGMVAGNLLLFGLVNVTVIVVSVFIVNLTSLAPVSWSCYLFYLLTLNLPSWLLVAGFSLWVSSVSGGRFAAIVLSAIWLACCLFWLPYHLHGTLDYTGSGLPNLFSEITGHINLPRYLLHRSAYALTGIGLLAWSARGMKRLPNRGGTGRIHALSGIALLLAGLTCGVLLEYSYYRDRSVRSAYRSSFERNWEEATCRVKRHVIRLHQSGHVLKAESDLLVYNREKEPLRQIVLFLNPGLRVTSVQSGGGDLPYRRDQQFVLIDRALGAGDTLSLRLKYEGRVDDRYCDLHLPDKAYEDTFHGDRFFPTGRRGAFTGKNFLLLTPACTWYPVAIPPVNPFMPLATGRDFTLFTLIVENPSQQTILSQGFPERLKNGIRFTCRNPLNGISLYGANPRNYSLPVDETFGFQVHSFSLVKGLAPIFSGVSRQAFASLWKDPPVMYWHNYRNFRTMSWYEAGSPYLHVSEVPVSFRLASHVGKTSAGLVEPGMTFIRERGFDLDMAGVMTAGKIRNGNEFFAVTDALHGRLFNGTVRERSSHPLWDMGRKGADYENRPVDWSIGSLGGDRKIWIHSLENPFLGHVFEQLQNSVNSFNMDQSVYGFMFSRNKSKYDYLCGHSLRDVLSDQKLDDRFKNSLFYTKVQDLWTRLTLNIPQRPLKDCLNSLYRYRKGEIDYDSLADVWTARWGVDIDSMVSDWVTTRHEQFFRMKRGIMYYNPKTRMFKAEGKIMNMGKTGGVVSIEYGSMISVERYSCYIRPGEAKAFTFILQDSPKGRSPVDRVTINNMNTGLSANRPNIFLFKGVTVRNDSVWEPGREWRPIPAEEFLADRNEGEFIVDDQDPGFELVDGNLTWLQKWFQKAPEVRDFYEGETSRWVPVVTIEAEGDSIQGCHCISGGRGKSTATWRVNLPEAGRYRVMGKVYRQSLVPGPGRPGGVVYYYTVFHGDKPEKVEVNLDAFLRGNPSGWASLGEYDFPAGEAKVVLSDKEVQRRKDVAIVADAVKWIKIE